MQYDSEVANCSEYYVGIAADVVVVVVVEAWGVNSIPLLNAARS